MVNEINKSNQWHTLTIDEVDRKLNSNHQTGLSHAQADALMSIHGQNALPEKQRRAAWRMLLDQLTDFMVMVLIAAAVISGLVGDIQDTIAILVIVLLNTAIGFIQEYRTERAMAALKKMSEANARVMRDQQILNVNAASLVPGDIVLLEAGSVVPADLRITETAQLRVDESALTGESVAVEKQIREEGLVEILEAAGFELRQPGCSACLAMNPDKVPAGKYAVSTTNRNFEGRQGPGARTLLASPLVAAACAITGKVTNPSDL